MILIKLSVTVICYNQENYIKETLDSILNQSVNFKFELIVADDASSDHTPTIIQEYADKYPDIIRPVLRKKNLGLTGNYIETTKLCRGEYIAHIDGDDLMLPGKLQKQVDFLDNHPECSIVHHPVYLIDSNSNTIKKTKLSKATTGDINNIVKGNDIVSSSNMFRRTSLDNHFYEMNKDLILHDWLAHIIKAQYGNIGFIPEYLGAYRVYEQSVIRSTSFMKLCESTLYTMDYVKNFNNVNIESVNKAKSIIFFTIARHFFKRGFYKRSEVFLKKSCELNYYNWDNFRYYIKLKFKKLF